MILLSVQKDMKYFLRSLGTIFQLMLSLGFLSYLVFPSLLPCCAALAPLINLPLPHACWFSAALGCKVTWCSTVSVRVWVGMYGHEMLEEPLSPPFLFAVLGQTISLNFDSFFIPIGFLSYTIGFCRPLWFYKIPKANVPALWSVQVQIKL